MPRLPFRLRPPARSIPVTRWRAPGPWRASPLTLLVLLVGLWLFGAGEALLIDAGLGVTPWTVLAQGGARQLGTGVGLATFLVSVVTLILWVPLRQRPGLGTLANAVVVAVSLDVSVAVLPTPDAAGWRLVEVLLGVALIGVGSGCYLTTGLGPGPRDGLMTGLHLRTGAAVTPVRLGIELTVLLTGWLLGGTVGLGTVVFALLVGPSVGYGLALAGRLGRQRAR